MKRTITNSKLANLILSKGFSTIMLFGFIFTKLRVLPKRVANHEMIHIKQFNFITLLATAVGLPLIAYHSAWWWLVLIPLTYYIAYLLEWLYWLITYSVTHSFETAREVAYYRISFEREAYSNEANDLYNSQRYGWGHFKYYLKKFTSDERGCNL